MRVKTVEFFALSTSLLSAGVFCGTASADDETVLMQLYGQRSWYMSCEIEQADGDRIASRERGRGAESFGRIAAQSVEFGLCDYSVAENGMLRVTLMLDDSTLDCPFTITEDGLCRAYFSGGSTGSFTLQPVTVTGSDTGS